ncbi:MAG TPA: DUF3443 family protein [Candidatus Acidoferrales bacterium]|jgi:hypothetical protein|nr:DUF3443 family protein [Candidatus Acidoferrales bacterium]
MRATYLSSIYLALGIFSSVAILGCGSSGTTSSPASQVSNQVSNVQPIAVNQGPASNYVDGAFTSVTICVPGSTTSCQTIGGILVDTGSSGLRILSSALTVSLPQQIDAGGHAISECAAFADGVTWGPVQKADVKMAGEVASSLPVQVIGASNFSTIPTACTAQGAPEDDLGSLGANGLLGIGQAVQDCGLSCSESGFVQNTYFSCPASGCIAITQSLAQQVQNPVASFATDNNGVIVELPTVSGSEATVNGSLIFGIGTQSNNGLGGATVFGTDPFGDFTTTYKAVLYQSFLDSGSNGIYFLNTSVTALPVCTDLTFLYCPTAAQTINVVNTAQPGTNGATAPASFIAGNGDALVKTSNNAAVSDLTGPQPGNFDFGLPFFFGRNVYLGITGKSTPAGTGPFTAY